MDVPAPALAPIETDGLAHLLRVHQQGLAVAAKEGLQGRAPGLIRHVHPVAERHGGDAVFAEEGDEAQRGRPQVAFAPFQAVDAGAQFLEGQVHLPFLDHPLVVALPQPLQRRRQPRPQPVEGGHDRGGVLGPDRRQQALVPAQQGRQGLQGLDQGGVVEVLRLVKQAVDGAQGQAGLVDGLVDLVQGLARHLLLGLEALPTLLPLGGSQAAVGLGEGEVSRVPLPVQVLDVALEPAKVAGHTLQRLALGFQFDLPGIEGRLLLHPAPGQAQALGLLGAPVALIEGDQGFLALTGLAGPGLDIPIVMQGLLQGADLDGALLQDVGAHEVRDVTDGGEGDGVAEGAEEVGRVEGSPFVVEDVAQFLVILADQGVDLEALAEALAQLFAQPFPRLGHRAQGAAVHQVRQHQVQAGGDEAPVDHLLGLFEAGMQGQAEADGLAAQVVAEDQGQVAQGLLPGAEFQRQVRVAGVAHHPQAVVAQAAGALLPSAGIGVPPALVAPDQHRLDGVQQGGLARGVGTDHRRVALEFDAGLFQAVPVDQQKTNQALHGVISPLARAPT